MRSRLGAGALAAFLVLSGLGVTATPASAALGPVVFTGYEHLSATSVRVGWEPVDGAVTIAVQASTTGDDGTHRPARTTAYEPHHGGSTSATFSHLVPPYTYDVYLAAIGAGGEVVHAERYSVPTVEDLTNVAFLEYDLTGPEVPPRSSRDLVPIHLPDGCVDRLDLDHYRSNASRYDLDGDGTTGDEEHLLRAEMGKCITAQGDVVVEGAAVEEIRQLTARPGYGVIEVRWDHPQGTPDPPAAPTLDGQEVLEWEVRLADGSRPVASSTRPGHGYSTDGEGAYFAHRLRVPVDTTFHTPGLRARTAAGWTEWVEGAGTSSATHLDPDVGRAGSVAGPPDGCIDIFDLDKALHPDHSYDFDGNGVADEQADLDILTRSFSPEDCVPEAEPEPDVVLPSPQRSAVTTVPGSLDVDWTQPATPEGVDPPSEFVVRFDNVREWDPGEPPLDHLDLEVPVSGGRTRSFTPPVGTLTPGESYFVSISARNSVPEQASGFAGDDGTYFTVPAVGQEPPPPPPAPAPPAIRSVTPEVAGIHVNFDPAEGTDPSRFEIIARPTDDEGPEVTARIIGARREYVVRPLEEGREYAVSMRAEHPSGWSDEAAWPSLVTVLRAEDPPPVRRTGYWMLGSLGDVYAFGDAPYHGFAPNLASIDIEPTPNGDGYWTVDPQGFVSGFGNAPIHGGIDGDLPPGETVTSISRHGRTGYWLFTDRGRVVPFGSAGSYGDMSGVTLNGPVLDSIPTPSGRGYYMVAGDGGIFAFGDARFSGSMGGRPLNAPVQSLVPDGDGSGYWLVAADGGIFAFDAGFYGSMGSIPLNRPVTGMVAFGSAGYLMVAEDGGIFAFGDAPFHGSLGDDPPPSPIVSVAVYDVTR